MALVPVIQPPIMRLLTTKKERVIKMKPARQVAQSEKIIFPIVGLILTCFVVPTGIPLLGMLFFGNLLRECGVTTRLAKTASNALTDIVTILLGMTVGASTQATTFLTEKTIFIFFLGFMAFIIASASGVLFVKLFNLFLPKSKNSIRSSAMPESQQYRCRPAYQTTSVLNTIPPTICSCTLWARTLQVS